MSVLGLLQDSVCNTDDFKYYGRRRKHEDSVIRLGLDTLFLPHKERVQSSLCWMRHVQTFQFVLSPCGSRLNNIHHLRLFVVLFSATAARLKPASVREIRAAHHSFCHLNEPTFLLKKAHARRLLPAFYHMFF